MTADRTIVPGADASHPPLPIPRARTAPATEVPAAPAAPAGGRRWLRLPRYSWAPTVTGLLFACGSFTPSLLPRGWLVQAIIAGITAAVGYGLGCVVVWFVYAFTDRRPSARVRRRAWQVLAVLGGILGLVTLWAAQRWQRQINELSGLQPPAAYRWVGIVAVSLLVFAALVGTGRLLRRFTRWVIRRLGRILPARVTRPLGVVAVTLLVIFLVNGMLLQGVVELANSSFGLRDSGTEQGAVRPTAPERSGSPASLIPWDSLGLQGRNFVGTGPTQQQLTAFSGRPALVPVRAYAGLQSAADPTERAALAVRDLQRAGGFDRKVLVVATTTGTGWIDPAASASLEYEFNGDTAMVATQYSFLPSWLSFLVDQAKAREAGRALFDAVYGVWAQLPPKGRPKLYVYGESLGSFGGEAAFTGINDVANRTDGVLWVGPPNFNELWRTLVAHRAPDSPEWLPVYQDGRTVRFANGAENLDGQVDAWGQPRVLYLQHASDPIVWWTPKLIFEHPDWLRGQRGPDVSQSMSWMPFVTFWQVTADLPFAVDVPAGHGHHYTADYVDSWAAVAQPPGWTSADTTRLRQIVGAG